MLDNKGSIVCPSPQPTMSRISHRYVRQMCPFLAQSDVWEVERSDDSTTTEDTRSSSHFLHLVSCTLPHLQQTGYWTHNFRVDNPYRPIGFTQAIREHRQLGHGMFLEISTRLEVLWLLTRVSCMFAKNGDSSGVIECALHHAAATTVRVLGQPYEGTSPAWIPPEKVAFLRTQKAHNKRQRASETDATRRLAPYCAMRRLCRAQSVDRDVIPRMRSTLAEGYARELRAPMKALWTHVRLFLVAFEAPSFHLDGWLFSESLACIPPLPTTVSLVDLETLQAHENLQRVAINDAATASVALFEGVRASYDRSLWQWLQFRRLLAAGEHDMQRFCLDEVIISHTFDFHFTTFQIALDLLFTILCKGGGWHRKYATRHTAAVAHCMLA